MKPTGVSHSSGLSLFYGGTVYENLACRAREGATANRDWRRPGAYLRELKNIASYLGYSGEEIDAMLADGWSTDEIEEAIYGC